MVLAMAFSWICKSCLLLISQDKGVNLAIARLTRVTDRTGRNIGLVHVDILQ